MHDFARADWANDCSREIWATRIERVGRVWSHLEVLSVASELRGCCLMHVTPEALVRKSAEWIELGLTALPLGCFGARPDGYTTQSKPNGLGRPFTYAVAIGRPDKLRMFKQAFQQTNHDAIGRLLGYPACCREFFQKAWVERQLSDPTWPMAAQTRGAVVNGSEITLDAGTASNVLWRWLGVRLVPHLPCNFNCGATEIFGQNWLRLGKDAGYSAEMAWMTEILSWPVEWTALHGLGKVKSSIVSMTIPTDATPVKHSVRARGAGHPEWDARGDKIPFQTGRSLASSRAPSLEMESHRRSALKPGVQSDDQSWIYVDNGFRSREAMDRAHARIVELSVNALQLCGGAENASVLDLGCGNGMLLSKIAGRLRNIPYGIDVRPHCIAHAKSLMPEYFSNFYAGDMFRSMMPWESRRRYDLIILMIGRLLEVCKETAMELLAEIKSNGGQLLIYSYDNVEQRWKRSFLEIAQSFGLTVSDFDVEGNLALARFSDPAE